MRVKGKKKYLFLVAALFSAIAIFSQTKTKAQEKHLLKGKVYLAPITVKFPRRGSSLVSGNTYTLKWTVNQETHGKHGNCFKIYLVDRLRHDNRRIPTNGTTICGTSYRWTFPDDLKSDDNYRITFTSIDGSKDLGKSDKFSIITLKPDLIITRILFEEDMAWEKMTINRILFEEDMAWEKMTIKALIENNSLGKAVPSKAKLTIRGLRGTFKKEYNNIPVPSLVYGQRHWLKITYDIPQAGEYKHTLDIDINDDVDESNEDNNQGKAKQEGHRETNLCDLVVCRYDWIEARAHISVRVPVGVKNIGSRKSIRSRLCIWIENRGKECFDIPALDPNETHWKSRNVYWTVAGEWRKYYGEIDPDNRVKEIKEDNNKIWGSIKKVRPIDLGYTPAIYHGTGYDMCSSKPGSSNEYSAEDGLPR